MEITATKHKEIYSQQNDDSLDIRDLVASVDHLLPDASEGLKNKFIDREKLVDESEYTKALLQEVVDTHFEKNCDVKCHPL
ncbi:hypothetical protein [Aliivibrio fischeri]|uniref:Uncharacterized protein n=1 Tax=Aliivibrio fischeri TaxID=668 RepID=A0A510USJ7_ALIFS|nr:hypothetical protein [Aliivibrio fischeri]MUK51537.1 hypothetical protein [Aliivibrio fischeri]GEK16190.1 hypothetical protein AFI02nite_42260 [Aliivibrio fischeri]